VRQGLDSEQSRSNRTRNSSIRRPATNSKQPAAHKASRTAQNVDAKSDRLLAAVCDAWPTLPAVVRAGIVAMVAASASGAAE